MCECLYIHSECLSICSVLQCVAVCCSVLQCVAVCCACPQMWRRCLYIHRYVNVKTFAMYVNEWDIECLYICSVLQCVAVCCSVLQCVAVCCSVSYVCKDIRYVCEDIRWHRMLNVNVKTFYVWQDWGLTLEALPPRGGGSAECPKRTRGEWDAGVENTNTQNTQINLNKWKLGEP